MDAPTATSPEFDVTKPAAAVPALCRPLWAAEGGVSGPSCPAHGRQEEHEEEWEGTKCRNRDNIL